MAEKMYLIDCCDNCFFAMTRVGDSWCGHEDGDPEHQLSKHSIPKWCPLEDAPKKGD